jgi:hypothetical protein
MNRRRKMLNSTNKRFYLNNKKYELRKVPLFAKVYEFDGTEYIKTIDIHGSSLVQAALGDWIKRNNIKVLNTLDNDDLLEDARSVFISTKDYEEFFKAYKDLIEEEDRWGTK